MRRPHFGRTQTQAIEIDHRLNLRSFTDRKMIHIIARTYQTLFLSREGNKHEGVMSWLRAQTVQQGWQEDRSRPVVHDAITAIDVVRMRANHYYFLSVSRQDANNVGWQLRANEIGRASCRERV